MNIRQIRNTIFTFAKPEWQTVSHSSGQEKHSCSVTRVATRASHLLHHCLSVFPSCFFSVAIHPTKTYIPQEIQLAEERCTCEGDSRGWCLLFIQTNQASVGNNAKNLIKRVLDSWHTGAVKRKSSQSTVVIDLARSTIQREHLRHFIQQFSGHSKGSSYQSNFCPSGEQETRTFWRNFQQSERGSLYY